MTINIKQYNYFSSSVYTQENEDFLKPAKEVSTEFLAKNTNKVNEIFPVQMTGSMQNDPRLSDFCLFIATSVRGILENQGYNIDLFNLYFLDMFAQKHYKNSSMEQHIHGQGVQIVGFYFLEAPENSSRVLFHEPNAAKVITNLPEKDQSSVTAASTMVNFTPKKGQFIFSNSWLPHSFTRNTSDEPLEFIHFNLCAELIKQQNCDVEIV